MKTAKKTGEPTVNRVLQNTVENRQTVEATTRTIVVAKKARKFTGARAQWYAALLAHDGQTTEAFIEACTNQPPATSKSGKSEDPRGWLRILERTGVARLA